jgi:hypothetical protein
VVILVIRSEPVGNPLIVRRTVGRSRQIRDRRHGGARFYFTFPAAEAAQ